MSSISASGVQLASSLESEEVRRRNTSGPNCALTTRGLKDVRSTKPTAASLAEAGKRSACVVTWPLARRLPWKAVPPVLMELTQPTDPSHRMASDGSTPDSPGPGAPGASLSLGPKVAPPSKDVRAITCRPPGPKAGMQHSELNTTTALGPSWRRTIDAGPPAVRSSGRVCGAEQALAPRGRAQ